MVFMVCILLAFNTFIIKKRKMFAFLIYDSPINWGRLALAVSIMLPGMWLKHFLIAASITSYVKLM